MQCDINRGVTKILALSSGKIDKHEYLTGEEILPPDQRRVIEQAKFAYSPLGKTFEKQTERQVDAMKSVKPFYKTNELKHIENSNQSQLIRIYKKLILYFVYLFTIF